MEKKKMKVTIVHPYRHHAYESLKGILAYDQNAVGLFGYFYQNDIVDKIIRLLHKEVCVGGYVDNSLKGHVKTSIWIKILFILSKLNPSKFTKVYEYVFQKWAISQLKRMHPQCVHMLQDYCGSVIEYARQQSMKIVYEQITVFDETRQRIFALESERYADILSNHEQRSIGVIKKIEAQRRYIQFADLIICASELSEKSVVEVEKEKKIIRIPYGCAMRKKSSPIKVQDATPLKCLYIGAFGMLKGVQYVVEAAEKLANEKIEFCFVGKIQDEVGGMLCNKIKKMKNASYIESIPHEQIYEFYERFDVFIFQPVCEGFGLVTLEAMTCGLPCLVSCSGRGVVEDGVSGFINDDRDSELLAIHIRRLHQNRTLLNQMKHQASVAAHNHSWSNYHKEMKRAYETI